MRALLFCLLIPALFTADAALAQAPDMLKVPTTKILAIGHLTKPRDAEMRNIMPEEVKQTVNLYLSGKIDQWYVRSDGQGVVFLMNVTTTEEAKALLEKLPLGVAGRMEFDLMPLGPLSPLRFLLPGGTTGAAKP